MQSEKLGLSVHERHRLALLYRTPDFHQRIPKGYFSVRLEVVKKQFGFLVQPTVGVDWHNAKLFIGGGHTRTVQTGFSNDGRSSSTVERRRDVRPATRSDNGYVDHLVFQRR
jgi:hypothetical protein